MHICKPGTWEEVEILVSLSEILSQKNQTKLKVETKLSENELLDLKMFHSPVKMAYDF